MGILSAFDLAETGRHAGLTITERAGKLHIAGPADVDQAILEQLKERRDDILGALSHSPRICAHCGSPEVVVVSWSGEPFCHPCAVRVGTELLLEEMPSVLNRPATLDDTPPPAPPGCIAAPDGTVWALQCRCGGHEPPGAKGHDARPVNYLPTVEGN